MTKAQGPEGVSNLTLKECNQQLIDSIPSIRESLPAKGKGLLDRKRDDILPVYKGASREDPLNYRPA